MESNKWGVYIIFTSLQVDTCKLLGLIRLHCRVSWLGLPFWTWTAKCWQSAAVVWKTGSKPCHCVGVKIWNVFGLNEEWRCSNKPCSGSGLWEKLTICHSLDLVGVTVLHLSQPCKGKCKDDNRMQLIEDDISQYTLSTSWPGDWENGCQPMHPRPPSGDKSDNLI